jgi:hypothetical protein
MDVLTGGTESGAHVFLMLMLALVSPIILMMYYMPQVRFTMMYDYNDYNDA